MIFVDLTKAFYTVDRSGLWHIVKKAGCSDKFANLIRSFHYGMTASVFCNGMVSDSFIVGNSVKQGCVLAPILFLIFFTMMLFVAFRDNDDGVSIEYRLDGGIFNQRRFRGRRKVSHQLVRELFADDSALAAHTLSDAQRIMDCFTRAARRFGLTVGIKTRSSAIAEGPRDASCQLKSCQLPSNSAETRPTCTTSPEQIEVMKLDG